MGTTLAKEYGQRDHDDVQWSWNNQAGRKNARNWGRAFSGASGEKNWGAHRYSCASGECD
jgi:hypothetical protein